MTEPCYLVRGAQTRLHGEKPMTCEKCFGVSVCKMHANFKQAEVDLKAAYELLDKFGLERRTPEKRGGENHPKP